MSGRTTHGGAGPSLLVEVRHPLRQFELDVRFAMGRETLALVGPSGAGKTSVLRAVAGLLRPRQGRILAGETTLVDTQKRVVLPPEDRAVGMVFQEGALFPHLTVAKNVAYGLRPRPRDRQEREERVDELLERFGVAGLAKARPGEISGGERQRVALARAVGRSPQVLLLDEPLSALDSVTKAQVSAELARWLGELRLPTILVSHDFEDVAGLADRVVVVDRGKVVQDAGVDDFLDAPASPFVAAFTGVNYFRGAAREAGDRVEVALEPAGDRDRRRPEGRRRSRPSSTRGRCASTRTPSPPRGPTRWRVRSCRSRGAAAPLACAWAARRRWSRRCLRSASPSSPSSRDRS